MPFSEKTGTVFATSLFRRCSKTAKNPLTFIACPEQHAQAVVDSTVRDINDWRGTPDDPMKQETHGITAIFLKCDDENVLNEAKEILRRYAEAVRLDEDLTYSVLRRQSTLPGGQEE